MKFWEKAKSLADRLLHPEDRSRITRSDERAKITATRKRQDEHASRSGSHAAVSEILAEQAKSRNTAPTDTGIEDKDSPDESRVPYKNYHLGRLSDPGSAPYKRATITISDPDSAWLSSWISELITLSSKPFTAPPTSLPGSTSNLKTRETNSQVLYLYEQVGSLAISFNSQNKSSDLRIATTKPSEVTEFIDSPDTFALSTTGQSVTYCRWRASTPTWCLSARGHGGVIEVFLLPVSEIMLLSKAELPSRLKARFRLVMEEGNRRWTMDGLPVGENEFKVLARSLLRDLVLSSKVESRLESDSLGIPLNLEGERLTQALRQMVAEKRNLVQKILGQQEEIQNRIARDLHDAVIADVMTVKRSYSGDKNLTNEEVVEVLDRITQHLREICHDLAPRDLKDWGLQTVVEDLLARVSERSDADCELTCDTEIPELPDSVQLHIYRIIQECLNNIEKYAEATKVTVVMESTAQSFQIRIKDNGKGFELDKKAPRLSKEGGVGLSSIRERSELIRSFFPTKLSMVSEPEEGSTTTLEIVLARGGED